MSVLVVVIPLGITTTWMDIKLGFSWKNMELSKSILARYICCEAGVHLALKFASVWMPVCVHVCVCMLPPLETINN